MKSLEEIIEKHHLSGLTINQAENSAGQEIILRKISKSPFANNVLIKGGVVMFNLTKNIRRATADLDFDFIRYDISDTSIRKFISLLNKYDSEYVIKLISIKPLKQEDYDGKRVIVSISDKITKINFKLDIGVHTLLGLEQSTLCFAFDDSQVFLRVNPIEQIFAEKIYSLAKHEALSTRYKDIFDIYYLITQQKLNVKLVKECLELLTMKGSFGIHSIDDIYSRVNDTLNDRQFLNHLDSTKDKWLDADTKVITKTIVDYISGI